MKEKTGSGGQVNLALAAPGKKEFQKVIRSQTNRMARWGVSVKLNSPVDGERSKREKPDLVVVASGAGPATLPVPGIDKPHVVQAWDVLSEKASHLGERVVIIGGNATGCETAHFIGCLGIPDPDTFTFLMYHSAEDPKQAMDLLHTPWRKITVVEMTGKMAGNVSRSARWSLMKSLKSLGVEMRTGARASGDYR